MLVEHVRRSALFQLLHRIFSSRLTVNMTREIFSYRFQKLLALRNLCGSSSGVQQLPAMLNVQLTVHCPPIIRANCTTQRNIFSRTFNGISKLFNKLSNGQVDSDALTALKNIAKESKIPKNVSRTPR